MKFKKKLIASAVAGMAGVAQVAYAAQGPVIEEVIVTAQKIEENIQKIPLSVTAMSSTELERKGISNFSDLLKVGLPGLSLMPFAGRTDILNISMRGVNTPDPSQGLIDPAIAILEDDVYNARGTGMNFGVAEIERMEVLRGPQGTLFGRNAVGGALRVINKKPTGEFGGNVKVKVGKYGYNSEEAHINTAEVGGFSFKFDLKQESRDGFVKNASTTSAISKHRDFGELDNQGGKFAVHFKATDSLKFDYSYLDLDLKQTKGYSLHSNPPAVCSGGVACAGSSVFVGMPFNSVGDYPTTSWIGMFNDWATTKVKNHRFGIDWDINDNLTLKSITTHSETDSAISGNNLNGAYALVSLGGAPFGSFPVAFGGPVNLPAFNGNGIGMSGSKGLAAAGLTTNQVFGLTGVIPESRVISKSDSQEFQLNGSSDTTKWVTGVYWYQEKVVDYRQTAFSIAYTGFAGGRPINPVAIDPVSLAFGGGNSDQSETLTNGEVKAYALYGQTTWTPSSMPQLHLTAGLRYSHEHRTFNRTIDSGVARNLTQPTFTLGRWDTTLAAAYDLDEVTNVYARYGTAYRAGGASVRSPWTGPFARFTAFKEEAQRSIEAGIKSDLMDRRLRLNVATYMTWIRGMQYPVQLDPTNPSIGGQINLPGIQKTKGVEADVQFAATDRLTLSGSVVWQSNKLASDVQDYINRVEPGATYNLASPAPKHQGQIAADYTLPVAVGNLAFHVDYAKSSKSPVTVRVPRGNYQEFGWTDTVNARVTWGGLQWGETGLKLSAYALNLGNNHQPIFGATAGQYDTQPPRTYGLEASLDF